MPAASFGLSSRSSGGRLARNTSGLLQLSRWIKNFARGDSLAVVITAAAVYSRQLGAIVVLGHMLSSSRQYCLPRFCSLLSCSFRQDVIVIQADNTSALPLINVFLAPDSDYTRLDAVLDYSYPANSDDKRVCLLGEQPPLPQHSNNMDISNLPIQYVTAAPCFCASLRLRLLLRLAAQHAGDQPLRAASPVADRVRCLYRSPLCALTSQSRCRILILC